MKKHEPQRLRYIAHTTINAAVLESVRGRRLLYEHYVELCQRKGDPVSSMEELIGTDNNDLRTVEFATQTFQALLTIEFNTVSHGFGAEISKVLDVPIDDELLCMIVSARTFTETRRAAMFNKLKQLSRVHLVLQKFRPAASVASTQRQLSQM